MYIGTDIIEIDRIEAAMTGPRFRDRIFTEAEQAYALSRGQQAMASYAGMFAAKEAFMKAIGTGLRQGRWLDIEILRDELGAPYVSCTGAFRTRLESLGMAHMRVSISHCKAYATAVVLLQ